MKYTSAEANKLLKQLMQDYYAAIGIERQSSAFLAATGEDPDSVRPEYDYEKTQENLRELLHEDGTIVSDGQFSYSKI